MEIAIGVLRKSIDRELESLIRLESLDKENQSTLHYEHIGDCKDNIIEFKKAICVLKRFGPNYEDILP